MEAGALTIKLTLNARGPYTISIHGAFWPEPRSDEVFGNDKVSNLPPHGEGPGLPSSAGRTFFLGQTLQWGSAVAKIIQRRLTEILAADVAGLSRLMGEDVKAS